MVDFIFALVKGAYDLAKKNIEKCFLNKNLLESLISEIKSATDALKEISSNLSGIPHGHIQNQRLNTSRLESKIYNGNINNLNSIQPHISQLVTSCNHRIAGLLILINRCNDSYGLLVDSATREGLRPKSWDQADFSSTTSRMISINFRTYDDALTALRDALSESLQIIENELRQINLQRNV